jgi:hypothetical protein
MEKGLILINVFRRAFALISAPLRSASAQLGILSRNN